MMTAWFRRNHDGIEYVSLPSSDNVATDILDDTVQDNIASGTSTTNTGSGIQCYNNLRNRFMTLVHILYTWWNKIFEHTQLSSSLSLLVILTSCSLCSYLGYYSVWTHQPKPFLDKSINSFSIPNHVTSLRAQALSGAVSDLLHRVNRRRRDVSDEQTDNSIHRQRERRSNPAVITASNIQTTRRWQIELVYLAVGADSNIFTRERLEAIHEIERNIIKHAHFKDFCWKVPPSLQMDDALAQYDYCSPPNSLLSYFYPSERNGKISYDGLGPKLVSNISASIRRAMTEKSFYWFVDDKINSSYLKSSMLRSGVFFGVPLKGYPNVNTKRREQYSKYKDFVVTYVDPLSKSSTDKLTVLYGGNEIFDYEVEKTFWNDLSLAFISLGCIGTLLLILTSFSLWLTVMGIISILSSFPVAFFLYRTVFNINALGILNGAAVFLIIGIGVDDVFVFINTYRQAHDIKNPGDRMLHTLKVAAWSTFFTSFTTAAAFASNAASSIPALYEFGVYMSLIVASCWVTVLLIMPAALNLWLIVFAPCESFIFSPCSPKVQSEALAVHDLLPSADTDEDTDVPMLQLDDSTHNNADDDDDPLLQLETDLIHELTSVSSTKREGCGLTILLQKGIVNFIAKPVIKFRWIVLGLFIVLTGVSVYLDTRLEAAAKQPQLFNKDTNAQRWMDLKSNLSAEGILCETCSGLFKIGTETVKHTTTTTKATANPRPETDRVDPKTGKHVITKPLTPPREDARRSATSRATTLRDTIMATTHIPVTKTTHSTSTPSNQRVSTTHQTTPTTKQSVITRRPDVLPAKTAPPYKPLHTIHPRPTRTPPPTKAPKKAGAVSDKYDACAGGKCDKVASRPTLEKGAMVSVVFGLLGMDMTNVTSQHVINDKGKVKYDEKFERYFSFGDETKISRMIDSLKLLCKVCKLIVNNKKLVQPNSGQCLPYHPEYRSDAIAKALSKIAECQNLPGPKYINSRILPNHAYVRMNKNNTGLRWVSFSFESTVYQGQSYFTAYSDYLEWEKYIEYLKREVIPKDHPMQDIFQTSDFWVKVFREVIVVTSAVFSLALSMFICVLAVACFTGHILLWLTVVMTISGNVVLVVALFYLLGWQLGAVEAISLSILVGSSVDYCVHLVEGYLESGPYSTTDASNDKLRQRRAASAVNHVGVSIVSSAITTIVAAIPLTQTMIQPFAKFGQIILINTSVSILYTLTVGTSLLGLIGPATYKRSFKYCIILLLCVAAVIGVIWGVLYGINEHVVKIPGPGGSPMFS